MLTHISNAEEVLFRLKTPLFQEIDSGEDNDSHWEMFDTDEQDYQHCAHWFRQPDKKKNKIHVTPIYH